MQKKQNNRLSLCNFGTLKILDEIVMIPKSQLEKMNNNDTFRLLSGYLKNKKSFV
jgi:hypothetical protein